jgi:hypothetical protein
MYNVRNACCCHNGLKLCLSHSHALANKSQQGQRKPVVSQQPTGFDKLCYLLNNLLEQGGLQEGPAFQQRLHLHVQVQQP